MALSQVSETIKIFFSFASTPSDKKLFEKLRKHLSSLKRRGLIDIWHDSAISAGSNTGDIIKSYIRTADIIVLLISADFFASEQCYELEMQYAFEQRAIRNAHIIPVLLRPTLWHGFRLEQYNPLPPNGKPVSIWKDLDAALTEVAKGIHRVVEMLANKLTGTRPSVKPPQFPLYMLPYRRNPFFTDRENTLSALHHYFTTQQTGQTRIQALYGPGGIGKTLLATEYICLHQSEYQAVLWLNAASHELVGANIRSLADQLGIPIQDDDNEQQRFAALQRWLQHHDRWLLVLDNLDDFSMLDQIVPPYSGGHVLLTTHSQATGPFAHAVSIDQMTIEEGALLLLRRAKRIPEQGLRDDASEADYLHAIAIAQEVEGYPLALDQAGAYIEENQRSLASYLQLFREHKARLLGMRGRLANDHPDPVTTTLTVTFEKIAQSDPNALELLRFFTFLHPDALPDEMLMQGASVLSGPLHTLTTDPFVLDAAIATLRRYSLVHHNADTTTLNLHRIVQIIFRERMTKKQQQQLAKQAVRLINATFPEVSFTTWEGCERYLPQAQHCVELIRDFHLTLKEGGLLLERLGFYHVQRGNYSAAETYLTQALHLQEQHFPEDIPNLAQTLNSLGLLYQRQARYRDAEAQHQRALELRERTPGPDHPKTAESLHNLAMLYGDLGEYSQAEQLYLRVLSLEERAKGADHPDVARTLNNLGLIYYHQGRYSQAETAYQHAITIYEQFLPANHPDLIYPLDGLGALAEARGDYQQAEALYRRASAICEHALGEKHPETAHSLNKLADIAEVQGHYQQAEALYQQALAIGEQALGPEHPDVALFLNNLAFLANKQEKHRQAEELYQRALNIYEQALGPEHPDVASVLNNLGQLYRKMGNMERAETFLRRALVIYKQVLGTTHLDTAQCLSNLADLLTELQADEEAAQLFQQALSIYLQTPDFEPSEAALVREKYASLLERVNRNEEAALLRQEIQKQQGQSTDQPPQEDH